jgi:hypothetical protein
MPAPALHAASSGRKESHILVCAESVASHVGDELRSLLGANVPEQRRLLHDFDQK